MRKTAIILLVVVGLVGSALADEAAPKDLKRGFEEGKFVDEYFGIVYEADDLKEGFGFGLGGPNVLWSGKSADGVDIELICQEVPREMSGAQWLELAKRNWARDGKTRTEMEEGKEPQPWVLFTQESMAGFERQHGHAFYPRGLQCFMVHAQVREKSETSGEAIRKALSGLTVAPKSDSFLLAHLIAKQSQLDPTDPKVLVACALGIPQRVQGYLTLPEGQENPELALRALMLAKEAAGEDTFDAAGQWQIASGIGLAQLKLGKLEEAVPTWKKAIELAAATEDAAGLAMNAWYNLACAYSLLGRFDEAFDALKKSFDVGGDEQVRQLKAHGIEDPDLENMRKDERWKELYPESGE